MVSVDGEWPKGAARGVARWTVPGGYVVSRSLVWSYGGGTQSIAIAVLIAQGRLPKPERIVMSDTGREATETWEWLETYVGPLLAEHGLTVDVASR